MTTEDKTHYIKVTADKGKYLTQVTLNEDDKRLFVVSVCTTRPQEWEEWALAQKEAWEQEHPVEVKEVENEDNV